MVETSVSSKNIKSFLRKEMKEYIKKIGYITKDEKNDLREWVESGNSVNSNPYYYSDEYGNPMDYISAMRVAEEQFEQMNSMQEPVPEEQQGLDDETEPPFWQS